MKLILFKIKAVLYLLYHDIREFFGKSIKVIKCKERMLIYNNALYFIGDDPQKLAATRDIFIKELRAATRQLQNKLKNNNDKKTNNNRHTKDNNTNRS